MASPLSELVGRWCEASGIALGLRPSASQVDRDFPSIRVSTRPGIAPARLSSWERRFGFALPEALKAWLILSDGFYAEGGPLIHPLSGIGPMVPFSRIPGLLIQPESWFELGNPNWETVCIDLGYRWPGGDLPLFTSGDRERESPPRLIAAGFADWFLGVLQSGGREFWFEPGFGSMGDPWVEHRRRVARPVLSDRLRRLGANVRALVGEELDDGSIARRLGISTSEVEAILRHLQHAPTDYAESIGS